MLNAGRVLLDVVSDSKGDGRSYLIALGLGVVSVLLTVLTLESDLVLYNVCFLITYKLVVRYSFAFVGNVPVFWYVDVYDNFHKQ